MTAPGTPGPARPDEDDAERAARAVLEAELGCRLVRVKATTGTEFPDYRTPAGDKAIEVKRLTSERFHASGDAYEREETEVLDPRLTGMWIVPIQRPDLSTTLPHAGDVPIFGTGTPTKLKNLAADLVEHLAVLEKHGLSAHTDPWPEPHMPAELAGALRAIAARLEGPLHYLRGEARPGRPGGVRVLPMHGYVRTGLADTLVDRLDQWFASPASTNLRRSLSHEPPGTERVAFLVFDDLTEPETRSAADQGTSFCPTRPPALPPDVDVVWILVGPVACRYVPSAGWSSRLAPNASAA